MQGIKKQQYTLLLIHNVATHTAFASFQTISWPFNINSLIYLWFILLLLLFFIQSRRIEWRIHTFREYNSDLQTFAIKWVLVRCITTMLPFHFISSFFWVFVILLAKLKSFYNHDSICFVRKICTRAKKYTRKWWRHNEEHRESTHAITHIYLYHVMYWLLVCSSDMQQIKYMNLNE